MGYRSNVALVFYTRKPDEVSLPALKLWFDENYPIAEAKGDWGAIIETVNDGFMVTYDDVKWYEGYDHPAAVDATLVKFTETFDADEDDKVAWEMVRIGEEPADIEQRNSQYCDWRLGVHREIHFN